MMTIPGCIGVPSFATTRIIILNIRSLINAVWFMGLMNYLECTRPTPHFITSPSPLERYIYILYTQNAIMIIKFFGRIPQRKPQRNGHVFHNLTDIGIVLKKTTKINNFHTRAYEYIEFRLYLYIVSI